LHNLFIIRNVGIGRVASSLLFSTSDLTISLWSLN
jgi:hypothetical protein